ncbi:hypothetical protein SAMN04488505_1021173 [Chitinophaga rupis]|uniref:Lipoprotein n=1 Tax=Chitinophaga rupis TaxID=573321 RepID=A0A1H7T8Q6_9BACT|nr:hypothetical protein [Chitinophaga rupis]SEL81272.1 hypothetical protein SAMN04488505_1021173 [Chitinophaga rupis]
MLNLRDCHALLFVCITATLLSSCKGVTNEEYFKTSFYQNEDKLKRLNHMIDSLIVPQLDHTEYTRYIIVDCEKEGGKSHSNKVCNPMITDLMRELKVTSVNLEKGPCDATDRYSLYIYKLNSQNEDKDINHYYYYHDLCDNRTEAKMGKDYTYIPFSDHWSLFVGKN